jgi:hypothetical protein
LFFNGGSIVTKDRNAELPWKQIVRGYLSDVMDLLFPEISELVDWLLPPVFLDKDLEQLDPDDEYGERDAVQLVKLKLKQGKSMILLFHFAIEARKDKSFEEMVMTHALRAYDRFEQFPSSLAVLCDFDSSWRPSEYSSEVVGTRLAFRFMAFKLLDYRERWEELESSSNPFSVVVMAHLKAEELNDDPQEKKNWKFLLVRGLYERSYNKDRIRDLFDFIDRIMVLPEEFSSGFWNDLEAYEQEKKMICITNPVVP